MVRTLNTRNTHITAVTATMHSSVNTSKNRRAALLMGLRCRRCWGWWERDARAGRWGSRRCREGCPLGGRDGLALPRREALWRAGCRGGGSSSARELMSINS